MNNKKYTLGSIKNRAFITGFFFLIYLTSIPVIGQNNLIPDSLDCSATRPPFAFTIKNAWESNTESKVDNRFTAFAGDIDGDGNVEVLAADGMAGGTSNNGNTVYVFDGRDGTLSGQFNCLGIGTGTIYAPFSLGMAIFKRNATAKTTIFIAGRNGHIYLYEVNNSSRPLSFTLVWDKTIDVGPSIPVVANLDGDGNVEIISGKYIIDANTGVIEATLASPVTMGNSNLAGGQLFSLVADVDKDSLADVIIGSHVYRFNGGIPTNPTPWKICPGFPTDRDGLNMAADINQDGEMDIVFVQVSGLVTVWTPSTGTVVGTFNVPIDPTGKHISYPFVGDIDGVETGVKKYPEICINTVEKLYAYKFDWTGFSQKWLMNHNDASGVTSLTMFDFNLDGVVELVYRDHTQLHIFNGSGTTVVDATPPIACASQTIVETPIIVDVTGDGSADIVVTGEPSGLYGSLKGEVMVFEGAASKWASCPKVWNQQLYSNLLINTDLTVPSIVKSPNITFTQTCESKNGNKVQFYNGGPMQAPFVSDRTYCPIDVSSDIYIVSSSLTIIDTTTVKIDVTFGNQGLLTVPASTPIRFYRDAISSATVLTSANTTLGADLPVGQTITISKTITVPNGTLKFYVRALDDGTNFPALGTYSDCNLTNNTKSFGSLELTKTVSAPTSCIDGTSVFTVTLTNNTNQTTSSPKTYNNVIITDSLSLGFNYISATSDSGSISAFNSTTRELQWTIPTIAPGTSIVMTYTAKSGAAGSNRNTAWIESINGISLLHEAVEAYVIVSSQTAPAAATILPAGAAQIISPATSVTLTATASGAVSYQWYKNGVEIIGAISNTHIATEVGNYTVTYFNGICVSQMSEATVVYIAIKPISNHYEACPDAAITLGVTKVTGMTFNWYTAQTGGTLHKANSDTIQVIKDATPIQTWWVEAYYGGITFPRQIIGLEISEGCGVLTPCVTDGSLIWQEDFGGNDASLPTRAPASAGLPVGTTSYNYVERTNFLLPGVGEYALLKNIGNNIVSSDHMYWAFPGMDDYTSLGDTSKGYFLTFDATKAPGQFYQFNIDSVTSGSIMNFSAWLMNINPPSFKIFAEEIPEVYMRPNLIFSIENTKDNSILATYATGDLALLDSPTWLNYSCNFAVPANVTKVRVRVINNNDRMFGTYGNDIAIDNVQARLCLPKVTLIKTQTCGNATVTLNAEYTDNYSTFTKNKTVGLKGYWIQSSTGDVNNAADWTKVSGSDKTVSAGVITINSTLNITAGTATTYYRFVTADPANVDNIYFRASSEVDPVSYLSCFLQANPDAAQVTMCLPTTSVNILANDSLDICTLTDIVATISTPSAAGAIASIDPTTKNVLYSYKSGFTGLDSLQYQIKCGTNLATAWAYITVVKCPDNVKNEDCVGVAPTTTWGITKLYTTKQPIYSADVPLVGNVDSDDDIEIICANHKSGYSADSIIVFNGIDGTVKRKFKTVMFNPATGSRAIAKIGGTTYIFVAEFRTTTGPAYLYKYDLATGLGSMFLKEYSTGSCGNNAPSILLTDFNGDGTPELMANDRIYNAATGNFLLDCNLLATTSPYGKGSGHPADFSTVCNTWAFPTFAVAADMDNDGKPEFVAGTNIYKIKIASATSETGNTCTVLRTISTTPTGVGDGFTSVADLNLDGFLDVVVSRHISDNKYVYSWDGKSGTLLGDVITINEGYANYGPSIPFIGDLDGDGTPDVAFSTHKKLHAYKYDGILNKFDRLNANWPVVTTDPSASTTLTLFDFNQDGKSELIYRDQDSLRIIDGISGKNRNAFPCYSATLNEYPIVADITGDGYANIAVLGDIASTEGSPAPNRGYLHVYRNTAAGAWAPARHVWNQWAYNAVNVNEDLTIPATYFNPATTFLGPCVNVLNPPRPFNGFLMQQTMLNTDGCPLFTLPHMVWVGSPIFKYHPQGDSLVVTVNIKNTGSAGIGSPMYITTYKTSTTLPNILGTVGYNNYIFPDETVTFTFTIKNFMPKWGDATEIIVRLNDNSGTFPYQQACYPEDSRSSMAFLLASADYAQVLTCLPTTLVDILTNDLLGSCTSADIAVSIITPSAEGATATVDVATKKILYSYKAGFVGKDSLQYQIKCGTNLATAWAYITVLTCPVPTLLNACSNAPYLLALPDYEGVAYQWQTSVDGTTWTNISEATDVKLFVTQTAFYRVMFTLAGAPAVPSASIELEVTTTIVQGGKKWYNVSVK